MTELQYQELMEAATKDLNPPFNKPLPVTDEFRALCDAADAEEIVRYCVRQCEVTA